MKEASRESISKELQKFVEDNIIDRSVKVETNVSFNDLGVDSFSVIQIVLFIERKYNVVIEEGDLTPENLRSIQSLADFVFNHEG